MYAVFETGGQQFKAAEGDTIKVEKLTGDVGSEVTLDRVLMVKTDSEVKIGTPFVEGAKVTGEIVDQNRHPKIIVLKWKRRKGYRKKTGHRQHFTQLKINKIEL